MNALVDLYQQVRSHFPGITSSADRFYDQQWGDLLDEGVEYAWFQSLANALNDEIDRGIPFDTHRALFQMLTDEYVGGSDEVRQCIDVSFVENLFWQVASVKCRHYWEPLPTELKALYLDFHRREP